MCHVAQRCRLDIKGVRSFVRQSVGYTQEVTLATMLYLLSDDELGSICTQLDLLSGLGLASTVKTILWQARRLQLRARADAAAKTIQRAVRLFPARRFVEASRRCAIAVLEAEDDDQEQINIFLDDGTDDHLGTMMFVDATLSQTSYVYIDDLDLKHQLGVDQIFLTDTLNIARFVCARPDCAKELHRICRAVNNNAHDIEDLGEGMLLVTASNASGDE